MKKMMVAILGIALLATSGLALAQGWGRGPGMGGGRGGGMGFGPCAADLNLSAEQIKQMQDLRTQFFNDKAATELRETLLAKKAALRLLWAQNDPSQEKIINAQKEVNEVRAQLQSLATQHRLQARGILTPEQQTQLQSCLSDTGNFGPGSGKRGGRGPGRGMGMGPGDCPRF